MTSHPKCGRSWVQHGNRTGHCAKCCGTFEGLTLFDKHQRILDNGRVECLDPSTLTYSGSPLFLLDGSWRGVNGLSLRRQMANDPRVGVDGYHGPGESQVAEEFHLAGRGD